MKNSLTLATVLLLTVLTSGCKKDEIVNNYYNTTVGNEPRTSALGFVSLIDEFGHSLRRQAGARVTIKGTTPLIEAMTDTNGRYQFDSLRAGNYVFTYNYPGYGAYEQEFMLIAAGGNQPVLITQTGPYGPVARQTMYQQSSTVASNLVVTVNPNAVADYDTVVTIKGLISPASTTARPRSVGIAFDTLANVSQNDFLLGFLASPYYGDVTNGTFQIFLRLRDLQYYSDRYGVFRPGQRMYLRAYGSPVGGPAGFMSRETGMYIWSSFNPQASNRADFAMPY